MRLITPRATKVLEHPVAFALQVLKAFRANQGLLLAGAVAYYAFLSIIPLLLLTVIVLSRVADQHELLETIRRALEHVAPGQGRPVVQELAAFLEHSDVIGWVLLGSIILFSALAFRVMENAISVIFLHRVATRKRHFLVSAVLPFGYIAFVVVGILIGSFLLTLLIGMSDERLHIFGYTWSLGIFSRALLYAGGVAAEIVLITSIYLFMPVGRVPFRHALIGGITAGLLWEAVRRLLAWYLATLGHVNVVYGSLTTAIVVLLSVEIAAVLLLFGAQVIAEYERIGKDRPHDPAPGMRI